MDALNESRASNDGEKQDERKTMRCELVQQIVSYREVGTELRDRMDALSDCGYSIKSVIETVVSNNTKNKQGFIIIYKCDIPNKYKEEN